MNLPDRSAATLSALERVGPDCLLFHFPHVCLVRIVQDDDLRRPKAAEWSGSPLEELAPEASEGGGMKNGGLHNFLPATVPIPESRVPNNLQSRRQLRIQSFNPFSP